MPHKQSSTDVNGQPVRGSKTALSQYRPKGNFMFQQSPQRLMTNKNEVYD